MHITLTANVPGVGTIELSSPEAIYDAGTDPRILAADSAAALLERFIGALGLERVHAPAPADPAGDAPTDPPGDTVDPELADYLAANPR